jgi:hypothetical protein
MSNTNKPHSWILGPYWWTFIGWATIGGLYWWGNQLETVPIWLRYVGWGFVLVMGVGLAVVAFLYAMAGLAMYHSAKQIREDEARRSTEEEKKNNPKDYKK